MSRYAYYPGCSLETMAASYHVSTLEVAHKLGIELAEMEDWNCCGATAYSHVDALLSTVLSARNLAIAEQSGLGIVAPCSACYHNLYSANAALRRDPDLAEHMNFALEADDLHYSGTIGVQHVMQLFASEPFMEAISKRAGERVKGLRVAPYYGCQIVRPREEGATLTEIDDPRFFEDLLEAAGAVPVQYPYRLRCCGASLIVSNRKAALHMLRDLLQSAIDSGAEVIATACPLCQTNLECYQAEVNRELGTDYAVPILYFTQLLGLALGVSPRRLGIGKEIVSTKVVLAGRARGAEPPAG